MKGDWIGSQRSKREPPSRPQRPRPAAKPFCSHVLSCGDRRQKKGFLCNKCNTGVDPAFVSSLARARPTDCRGDRSWPHERRRRTHVEAATAARATVELPGAHCVSFYFASE